MSRTRSRFLAGCGLALALGAGVALVVAHGLARRVVLTAPPPTALMVDAGGRFLAELGGTRRGFWPIEGAIPERVLKATLAAEDIRFAEHPGVDARAVARAAAQDLRRRKVVEGASTIAMQVARLQAPGPRSWVRKAAEALVALSLTARFGRDAVLRHYLTIAPYGNQYHGVAYAARRYFGKPLADLTWAEAALLASLPRLPGRMNVYKEGGRRRAERRARYVITRLREQGGMTGEEAALALDQLPRLELAPRGKRPAEALHAILAMAQEVRAGRLAPGPGHVVRASLDLDVQAVVSRVAQNAIPDLRADGAGNVAALVVDAASGKIVAYLGSAEFDDVPNRGSIDYARTPRSPGSALKPFIYGLGMARRGFTGATVLSDVGLCLDANRGGYRVKNYDGGYLGPILYRNALANSRNIPAVEVLAAVGVDATYEHFRELGLVRRWRDPKQYGLSLALGGLEVTLADLVRAYGVLASDGLAYALTWAGDPAPRGPRARLIPRDIARQITGFLSDPVARLPSFPRLGWLEYPFPVAVKTGTSQGFRDAWCVAYSRRYLVGAWIGHADNAPMKRRAGADSAAAVVHRVMAALHPEEMRGLADLSFPPPQDYVSRKIDMLTGKLARDDTPFTALEWFRRGTEPVEWTDAYVAAGGKRLVKLPPRYAAWARECGLDLVPPAAVDPRTLLAADPRLAIVTPRPQARLVRDPETPRDQSTIALEASVDPPAPQVVWYVDGRLLCVADYPYTARWNLVPGEHTIQVGLPYAPVRSERVRVSIAQ